MKYFINSFLVVFVLTVFLGSLSSQDFTCFENTDVPSFSEWTTGEFNGDEVFDFLTISSGARKYYTTKGIDYTSLEFVQFSEGVFLDNFIQVDFDLDGDVDILASALQEDRSLLFLNNGAGDFEEVDSPFPQYKSADIADTNGDGNQELILGFEDGIKIYYLSNSTSIDLENGFATGNLTYALAVDYNNDGLTDVVSIYTSDELVVFEQDANGNFEQKLLYDEAFLESKLITADLNQDGVPDFINYNFRITIILSQQGGGYEDFRLDVNWGSGTPHISDFNMDGIPELLLVEGPNLNHTVTLFQLEADTFSRTTLLEGGPNTNLIPGGIADLDDDGDLDLYYRVSEIFDSKLIFCYQGDVLLEDNDGDGFTSDVDCDDENAAINPGAEEICDDLDNNCNGQTDEFLTFLSWWIDADGDGYGAGPMDSSVVECKQPLGYVQNYDDCDDTDASINVAATEIPDNGIDEDCDGEDLSTSAYELSATSLEIYPNPSYDKLFIKTIGNLDFKTTLLNFRGQIVGIDHNSKELSLSKLDSGIYMLMIEDNDSRNRIVHRLIKL